MPMPSCSHRRRAAGFTLIELLTVIAIIGILAAIIIPTVGKVRSTAKSAQCKSNLRQIGMMANLYAEDNRGNLPRPNESGEAWDYKLLRYFVSDETASQAGVTPHNVFACPSTDRNSRGAVQASTYGINQYVVNPSTSPVDPHLTYRKLHSVPNPSQVYFVTDCDAREFNRDQKNNMSAPQPPGTISARDRHDRKVNMLYVDGHVSAVDFEQLGWSSDRGRAPWSPR